MSIEEIKERLRLYKDTDDSHYTADIEFLLEQNHRLKEKLDEERTEWRKMFSKSAEIQLALYTLNLCCPDPETMEFEWEDGKEDYIDALNKARSLL